MFGATRTREEGRESCEGGEGVRCEGEGCEGVRCEGVGCEGVTVRGGEEEDDRGFEYTTTANIARHLRSETNRGTYNVHMYMYEVHYIIEAVYCVQCNVYNTVECSSHRLMHLWQHIPN